MLYVRQESKGVSQESGDSEERVERYKAAGVLAPVQSPQVAGVGGDEKGSSTRTERADSAL